MIGVIIAAVVVALIYIIVRVLGVEDRLGALEKMRQIEDMDAFYSTATLPDSCTDAMCGLAQMRRFEVSAPPPLPEVMGDYDAAAKDTTVHESDTDETVNDGNKIEVVKEDDGRVQEILEEEAAGQDVAHVSEDEEETPPPKEPVVVLVQNGGKKPKQKAGKK